MSTEQVTHETVRAVKASGLVSKKTHNQLIMTLQEQSGAHLVIPPENNTMSGHLPHSIYPIPPPSHYPDFCLGVHHMPTYLEGDYLVPA